MKKFLKNYLTIIGEFIVLILGSIWFSKNYEIEPLILIVLSFIALISSAVSYLTKDEKTKEVSKIGNRADKILHEDFLYNYIPGELTIGKVIQDLGQPLVKIEDFVEREYVHEKEFKFWVYKYKFSNAVVLFTTEINDENIISISLISKLDKENPIKCRYSFSEDDKIFGEAYITKNIIENSNDFKSQTYASWMYSLITSRYVDFRPIKYLDFTYFVYNQFDSISEMENQEIDGICISIMNDVKPIIHYDDYIFV